MKVSARYAGEATIVDVAGDIDLHSSPDLRRFFLELFRDTPPARVVVNLKDVRFVDSSGLSALVEGLKAAMKVRRRFVLYGLQSAVSEVLKLTQLITVFEVFENEEQALQ